MAPRASMSLRLILLDVGVNDARDVVFVFLNLFEQRVVFFLVLVLDLVLEIVLGLGCVFGRHRFAVFVLGVFGLDRCFLDNLGGFLRFFRLLAFGRLGLLDFLVVGDDDGRRLGHWFGQTCAPLLQKRFGLKGEGAFRTFDRALLQIVETGSATGANSLGSEVGLGQGDLSGKKGTKGRWVCHDRTG